MEINENTVKNLNECIDELEEALQEAINIVQLFADATERGEEANYIQRSIHTIEKMLKAICDKNIKVLKDAMSE